VSIGCELLTRPGLLLLDEPTTGLDSTNAARVVDILASLSHQQGVTVLLSIHQPRPDIFRLMDRVMLLSGEGQVGAAYNSCFLYHSAADATASWTAALTCWFFLVLSL
jgi:ATP-binding cassette subfamily G (WHITE) protein 2